MTTSTETNQMTRQTTLRSALRPAILAVVAATTLMLALAGPAQADFGLQDGSFTTVPGSTRAGGHGDLTTTFALNELGPGDPDGTLKNLVVDLPPGMIGNPQAAPQCDIARVQQGFDGDFCPMDTAVGYVTVDLAFPGFGFSSPQTALIYNIKPDKGEPAAFGFSAYVATVRLSASVRSGSDYGIRMTAKNITEQIFTMGGTVVFWGVPADHTGPGALADTNTGRSFDGPSAEQLRQPFLSNPTNCQADPLAPKMSVASWQNPAVIVSQESVLAPFTGCGDVPFDPSMTVRSDSADAGVPAGYTIDLNVPQPQSPNGLAEAHLKKAVVKLPPGVVVSASAADGQKACSDEGIAVGTSADPICPDASKVGTVQLETPVLPAPMIGSVYLGEQRPDQLLRLFIVARGAGVTVKLPGIATPDPETGQLTVTFDDNPQLPFSELHMVMDGGPQAPLTNPPTCGTATTSYDLTSWASDTPVHGTDSFQITGNCDAASQFTPGLEVGLTSPTAGGSSPFTMRLTRPDGQQDLSGIEMSLPPGLVARVGDVPLCPEAQLADGTCAAASQVGTTTVGAGPGINPVFIPQPGKAATAVYLGGPYKGAPFSLSIVVPAQAGPFDLGTVVVRAALFVDKDDAHVTVKADPLPTILKGIPLRLRDVRVALDRPGFMVTPTNCDPMAINARITSSTGTVADLSNRFQAADCAALPFDPTISAKTRGKLTFKHGAELKAHIAARPGDANIRSVSVRLPKQLPSRLIPTINNACLMSQFLENYKGCPEQSYIGTTTAYTPILNQPLKGPAYIVAVPGEVPVIELKLFGQGDAAGVEVNLAGTVIIDSGGGRSKVTFSTVPDIPITGFDMELPTGPHSMLDAPSKDLCGGPITMDVSIIAQNGKRQDRTTPITVKDCPKVGKPKVVKATASRSGVRLRVQAPAAGVLNVSGNGLKPVRRRLDRKLIYVVTLPLSDAGKQALARTGRLTTRPTLTFKPTNGPKTSTVRTSKLTIRSRAAR